ncbi:MAG: hypothetical protein KF773_09865 [Deltaproteobacteria bacterium]|nr:hypothetical protein [Deltaproteobacteria bacterium]
MRALVVMAVLVGAAAPAAADRPLCGPNARYRGAPIDLDVKNAEIHDVFRLLADTGRTNIVVGDAVTGRVTMRLRRVPWDQVACTVAATKGLTITVDGDVLLVVPAAPPR